MGVDLAAALQRLAADGPALTLVGRLPGGEVGATEVRDPDGRRLVVKLLPSSWGTTLTGLPARVDRLRSRGYPVPRHDVHPVDGFGLLVVQEHVAGTVPAEMSDALLDRLLALNDLQAGLDERDAEPWGETLRHTLTVGADGFCLHEPLRRHSGRSRALLERVESIGERLDPRSVPGGDVVHTDMHHLNVLQDGGTVRAVIDWEGSRGGDRVFDLVTLAFDVADADAATDREDRVWRIVEGSRPAATMEAYVAHMALRQVDWSIRHHAPAVVDRWLDVGERLLVRCAV